MPPPIRAVSDADSTHLGPDQVMHYYYADMLATKGVNAGPMFSDAPQLLVQAGEDTNSNTYLMKDGEENQREEYLDRD